MRDGPGYDANLERGILLREQGRYKEASEYLGKAIEQDPKNASAYAELALCLNQWGGKNKAALEAIDVAISLDPTNDAFLASKGWILVCQRKLELALEMSKKALALAPLSLMALNVQVNAYTQLREWKKAEAAARQSLSIATDESTTLNLLAQILRLQGRIKESRQIVQRILSRLPNDSFGQANAGFGALEIGDYHRANEHFIDALMLDPNCDIARRGLLDSLRARVWIFRLALYLARFHRKRDNGEPAGPLEALIVCSVFLFFGPLCVFLNFWHQGLGYILFAEFFLCFQFFVFAYPTGNIFLLFDPMGQKALTKGEKHFTACFALVLVAVLLVASVYRVWWLYLTLVMYLGVFAVSIYYPLIMDRLLWRRQSEVEA